LWAAFLMAMRSNGLSVLQLRLQPGLGSCESAWLLAAKLLRAMVNPDRAPLAGLVEVGEDGATARTDGWSAIPARPASSAIPLPSDPWPPTSFCRGRIAASGASISNALSTSSSSA
jgi:hypothetical protein